MHVIVFVTQKHWHVQWYLLHSHSVYQLSVEEN